MRRTARLLGCLLALVMVAPVAASADPIDTGQEPDCLEMVPTQLSFDFAQPIDLQVLVLLDGVPQEKAEHSMAVIARPYGAVGIRLHPRYETAPATSSADPDTILDSTRRALGGRRPDGVNLVYTMTAKDLVTGDGDTTVAGMSDCIGGIAFADRGFAVGEIDDSAPNALGLFGETTAKIEGHELGHLLGGQHHYANCAEAPATDADRGGCTLLINDVGLAELKFSTLNAAVIRGHAETWTRRPLGFYDPAAASASNSSGAGPSSGQPSGTQPQPQGSSDPSPRPSRACRRAQARVRRAAAALRSARRAHRRAHTRAARRRTARTVTRRRVALRRAAHAAVRVCKTR